MAKKSAGFLLYEAIQKSRKRKGLFERFRRSRSVNVRNVDTVTSRPAISSPEKAKKQAVPPKSAPETDTKPQAAREPVYSKSPNWPPKINTSQKVGYDLKLSVVRALNSLKRIRNFRYYVIGLLVLVLLALSGVKISQMLSGGAMENTGQENLQIAQNKLDSEEKSSIMKDSLPSRTQNTARSEADEKDILSRPMGDNVIVIVQYPKSEDLVPVQEYFAANGIETVIKKSGNYYFLMTKDRYDNPKRQGSEGYQALRRIKEVGAGYSAPKDFERFGSKPFQDAYGMKVR